MGIAGLACFGLESSSSVSDEMSAVALPARGGGGGGGRSVGASSSKLRMAPARLLTRRDTRGREHVS